MLKYGGNSAFYIRDNLGSRPPPLPTRQVKIGAKLQKKKETSKFILLFRSKTA